MIIRAANSDDYDALATVWHQGWASTNLTHLADPSWERLRARIPHELENGWSLYAGEQDETIVAMLAFRLSDFHLDQVFVAPGHQGKGWGRELLAFARRQMPREIWLRCAAENIKAWQWYERAGFRFEKEATHEASGMPMKYYRWRHA